MRDTTYVRLVVQILFQVTLPDEYRVPATFRRETGKHVVVELLVLRNEMLREYSIAVISAGSAAETGSVLMHRMLPGKYRIGEDYTLNSSVPMAQPAAFTIHALAQACMPVSGNTGYRPSVYEARSNQIKLLNINAMSVPN